MDLWYSRAKGTTTYAGLVNSTSKLTELGSIIGNNLNDYLNRKYIFL